MKNISIKNISMKSISVKKEKISETMNSISPKFIDEAVCYKGKTKTLTKKAWYKWMAAAACFAVLIIAGTAVVQTLFGGDVMIHDKYKYHISADEADVEWPWEYKTNGEKYQTIEFGGNVYNIKYLNPIDTEVLGDVLGICKVEGVDSYTDKKYTETFEVRKLSGVSQEKLVAAGNDRGFYVYAAGNETMPATFGELSDTYGLTQNVPLNLYTVYEGYDEKGYFNVNDDAYIWQVLSGCREAKLCDETDSFDRSNRNYLSFTATSDALGVDKRVIDISEDGYFATNIFDYSYIYFIGEESAGKIISYAKSNSTETQFEPYALSVSGTLTEIEEDYVLIDDSILCANEEDGIVYKIYTGDIRIKRCIKCTGIKAGDTVLVIYEGTISAANEISGAYSMNKGTLEDGALTISECY